MLTPSRILVIVKWFRKNDLPVCLNGRNVWETRRMAWAGIEPQNRRGCRSLHRPEVALFLRRAWDRNRIGARAFSTLEGYAGRNRRNGVGFPRLGAVKRTATVPVLV